MMKLPTQAQPVLRNVSAANTGTQMTGVTASSRWNCHTVSPGQLYVGTVDIWWGHTSEDATWACNNWLAICGDSQKGCLAYGPVV